VISRRYLKSSTILTSHTGVASWGERLADPMLAASLLDRLLHRGIVVAIDGPSFDAVPEAAGGLALRIRVCEAQARALPAE
jgi:DNA replication protein DnaC